jgi:hypothetical protein
MRGVDVYELQGHIWTVGSVHVLGMRSENVKDFGRGAGREDKRREECV